jgi:mycothiol synthase
MIGTEGGALAIDCPAGSIRPSRLEDEPALRAIMALSIEVDAIPGFAPQDADRQIARMLPDPAGTVVACEGELVVGYCVPRLDVLTVHPGYRRRGHGRRLVAAALDLVRRRGELPLNLFVPAHIEASRGFAEALGFRYRSSLWRFELPPDSATPSPAFPTDVVVRSWSPDEDVEAWVEFMIASFEGHPSQISPTPEVIRAVNARPDFDPQGILILSPAAEPDRKVAFARVELLPPAEEDGRPVGYVNTIGVLPAWRGRGLGRELLRWSVAYLRGRGAGLIELSVEAANERATELYRRHGFVPTIEWPNWTLDG